MGSDARIRALLCFAGTSWERVWTAAGRAVKRRGDCRQVEGGPERAVRLEFAGVAETIIGIEFGAAVARAGEGVQEVKWRIYEEWRRGHAAYPDEKNLFSLRCEVSYRAGTWRNRVSLFTPAGRAQGETEARAAAWSALAEVTERLVRSLDAKAQMGLIETGAVEL